MNQLELHYFINALPFGVAAKSNIIISRCEKGYGIFHVFYNAENKVESARALKFDEKVLFSEIIKILSYVEKSKIPIEFIENWYSNFGHTLPCFHDKNIEAHEAVKQSFKLLISHKKR